ncbi:MAG TPA: hypothetical protein DCQ30_04085 [Acidimicrobiaceae bacterium]|nr:hypothetical protein [Acidimicrobiaceae bacterium]
MADEGTSPFRRPKTWMLVVAALVAVGTGVGVWLGASGPAGGGTPATARQLVRASLADARAAGSFHYVSSSISSSATTSNVSQVTDGDAASQSGRQVITLSGDTFDVVVAGATAYFRGDAAAMVVNLGIPIGVAEAHARQWIALVAGEAPYQSVEVAVTTASALDQNITFSALEDLGSTRVDGTQTTAIEGRMRPVDGQPARGTATLYVSTSRHPLPVRYVESGTVGSGSKASRLRFSMTFSSWGESVGVSAPAGAIPFTSLGASGGGPPSPGPTILT